MNITKRTLQRIIREEARRLAEDHIDTELDHLKKNIGDDLEHIKDLKDDIKDDHDEEMRAEKEKKEHNENRKLSYGQLRKMIREMHQGYDDHEDESLGIEHGAESEHEQDYHDRRDDAEGDWGTRDDEVHVHHHHHHHDDQGYDDREDERLAAEHGAEDAFDQSMKDRRDDAGFENESLRRNGRKLSEIQLRRIIRRHARRG